MNSLNQICKHMSVLEKTKRPTKDSTSFLVGKLRAEIEFTRVETIERDVKGFIQQILEKLVEISQKMEQEFFNY